MRRSRKKKPKKLLIPRYNRNSYITAPEVRVLSADGENIGVLSLQEALAKAEEMEMDLIEINPKADPPVCQIADFTQFKYQKEKEARKQKAKTHVAELKGIRLSIRISEHDMDVRLSQAKKFLDRGDKTKIEIILRGRERGKADIAGDTIRRFVKKIEELYPIRYEQEVTRQGSKMTAIVAKK